MSFFLFAASGQSQGNEGGNEERVFHFEHSYHKKTTTRQLQRTNNFSNAANSDWLTGL